jgi:MFS family permease
MFTPGIKEIATDLGVEPDTVIGATTGFVVLLGIGPLLLAPLSETFGRRRLYIICFGIFALLQIPTALSPNVAFLITIRTISGFFGSVGIANGGGTISDMFEPSQRAGVFGWYLYVTSHYITCDCRFIVWSSLHIPRLWARSIV